jgi:multidrug resistance efflux pump
LVAAAVAARSMLDEAQRDYDVAEARLKEAHRQEELVNAPPVSEDLAKADADVTSAENRLRTVSERLSKCTVKAPITGTVLRVLLRPGEAFSTITPKPLFTMSDLSGRRVRAEVDEKDVTKVRVGQRAVVTSDAHSTRKFYGTVSRLAASMGRKKVASGDPAEKADRDVLEVMVDLDETANQLPVGLRVVVRFTDEAEPAGQLQTSTAVPPQISVAKRTVTSKTHKKRRAQRERLRSRNDRRTS